MHGTHEPLGLGLGECHRVSDVDLEVAEPGRLHQLVGADRNFYTGFSEVAGLQILHGIESGAGAQRSEHQLRGSHAGVIATALAAGRTELCGTVFGWKTLRDRDA